jgi:ABC-type phosphate/phosphonate transport system substrate-binding protein
MYAVTPAARTAWHRVFSWVMARAGVPMAWADHEPPLLLADLWQRQDLGAVLMCGLPLARRAPPPSILAQCVPSPQRYGGQAVYGADLVVAAAAPFRTLADTFGQRAGYTLKDSQSGYYAFRHHLLTHDGGLAQPYRHITGMLMNARGVIRAIAEGRIDVGPLDGYAHDLLRHTDPEFAAQVRVIAETEPTPMPAIVATAALEAQQLAALRAAFQAVVEEPSLRADCETLLIKRFVVPDASQFQVLRERAQLVDEAAPWPDAVSIS